MRQRSLNRMASARLARRTGRQEAPGPVAGSPAGVVRAEIRRSGGLTARLRWVSAAGGILAGPGVLLLMLPRLFGVGVEVTPEILALGAGLAWVGLGVGLGVGAPVSLAMLRERRALARRRLAELPPEQQMEVLLSLRNERGDTRRIVAPLLRELGISTEVSPSGSADGSGNELEPG